MHRLHYGEHPDGVQLRHLRDPTVSGGDGGGVGGVGESTLIDEDFSICPAECFPLGTGDRAERRGAGHGDQHGEGTGTSEKEVLAQLEDKYQVLPIYLII